MLRILRSEWFTSLMLAVALMSLFETLAGQGRISSAVLYVALLFSSIGALLGLIARASAQSDP